MRDNFAQWCEFVNNQFLNKKNKRIVGFSNWFNSIKEQDNFDEEKKSKFAEVFALISRPQRGRGKKREPNDEKYFLALVVAKSFYKEEFEYFQCCNKFNDEGIFKSSGAYMKAISSFLRNEKTDDSDVENGSKINLTQLSNSAYWFEIASALQKQFSLFSTIDDINKYVRAISRFDVTLPYIDYGLYVRNVNELCVAFSIIHGYSVEQADELIRKGTSALIDAQDKKVNKVNLNTTQTQELQESFFAKISRLDEETFISNIIVNCDKLVLCGANTHWSTVEQVASDVISGIEVEDLKECKTVEGRLSLICEEFYNKRIRESNIDNISDNCDYGCDKNLGQYLLGRLGFLDNNIKPEQYVQTMTLGPIRCLYIVSIMKDLYKGEEFDAYNVRNAISHINGVLNFAFLREIDYKIDNNKININSTDIFDWFITECLNYEQELDLGRISGYSAFIQYVSASIKELIEELGK